MCCYTNTIMLEIYNVYQITLLPIILEVNNICIMIVKILN